MSAAARPRYTMAEFHHVEEYTGGKHEYIQGVIYAMSGGTLEHSRLGGAVYAALSTQLEGKRCVVFTPDARIRVEAHDVSTYADVSVVCGNLDRSVEDRHAMTNPSVVVEVTSPSSDDYDRKTKFDYYRALDSLREYVLVSHLRHEIEVCRREADGTWSTHIAKAGERAQLASIDCLLDVDAIYRDPLA